MWTTHGCRRSTRSPCPCGSETNCDSRRQFVSRYGENHAHAERRLRVTLRTPSGPADDGTTSDSRLSSMATHWLADVEDTERSRNPALNRFVVRSSSARRGPRGAASGADSVAARRSRPLCRERSSHAAYVPGRSCASVPCRPSDTELNPRGPRRAGVLLFRTSARPGRRASWPGRARQTPRSSRRLPAAMRRTWW